MPRFNVPRILFNDDIEQFPAASSVRTISTTSSSYLESVSNNNSNNNLPVRTISNASRLMSFSSAAAMVMGSKRRVSEILKKGMVSIRTLTWTSLLMQLVISSVCFVASLAIISAKMNSESIYEDKQYVSFEWWLFCFLSLSMIITTVVAMYALSEHDKFLLIPHIFFLILCNGLSCYILHYTISNFDTTDFNWYIGLISMIFIETFLITCLIFEVRTMRSMTWLVFLFLFCLYHPLFPIYISNFVYFPCSFLFFKNCSKMHDLSIQDPLLRYRQAIKDSGKLRFCAFLTLQASIALYLIITSFTNWFQIEIWHDDAEFRHFHLIPLTIFTIWFVASISAIFCTFFNCRKSLRIHFIFNIVISFYFFLTLIASLIEFQPILILLTKLIVISNLFTLHFEYNFLNFLTTFNF